MALSFERSNCRLGRWALKLLQYDFEIQHRKDALHHVPDALSRMYEPAPEMVNNIGETEDVWYIRRTKLIQEMPYQFPDWKMEDGRLYCHRPDHLTDPLLSDLEAWKLVLPQELRTKAMYEAHDTTTSGHLGTDKNFQRLSLLYYWPGMFKDVANYVRSCKTCQKMKVEQAELVGLWANE